MKNRESLWQFMNKPKWTYIGLMGWTGWVGWSISDRFTFNWWFGMIIFYFAFVNWFIRNIKNN